eukprot:1142260-Pelagomonas_calceolata.AAC.7
MLSPWQAPGGLQALYAELSLEGSAHGNKASGSKGPSKTGTASALAFLASVVKDHGAVAPVVALLQKDRGAVAPVVAAASEGVCFELLLLTSLTLTCAGVSQCRCPCGGTASELLGACAW